MIRINLLKPERRESHEAEVAPPSEQREKKMLQAPGPGLIFLLLIIVVGVLFITQRRALSKEQNLLREAKAEKKKFKDVGSLLEQLEQQKSLSEKKIKLIEELKSRQETAVTILNELNKIVPDWVWLKETTYSKQTVSIKGAALSNNLISDFLLNLENCLYFTNVNFNSSTQRRARNTQYFDFSLTAKYVVPSDTKPSSEEDTTRE